MRELALTSEGRCTIWSPTGRWITPFRRALARRSIELRILETETEFDEQMRTLIPAVVLVEMAGDIFPTLGRILTARIEGRPLPQGGAIPVALLDPSRQSIETVLLEAGCVHVETNVRDVDRSCRLIQSILDRIPRESNPLTTQLQSRLPWSDEL